MFFIFPLATYAAPCPNGGYMNQNGVCVPPAKKQQGSSVKCPTGTSNYKGVCVPTKGKTGLSDSDVGNVIENVTKFVTGLIAVLSIFMIVVSGIMYITSAGDDQKVTQAKNILTFAIIGLVVALLGYVIVIAVGSATGAW
ncbi:MAG: hypothetical protein CR972_04090 [Candidatus Moraniibacteriota bacterium]|nr:MAG: hypothetical protein CR972_04090 [Candidatus Moranbacteria bacterium]